jgi:T5SS/PEP-CTERM-associated repeat protein
MPGDDFSPNITPNPNIKTMNTSTIIRIIRRFTVVPGLCLAVLIGTASGATRTWLTAVDGDFTDTTKWSSSLVPGSADLANFSTTNYAPGSEFTVTLTGSPITNENFRLVGVSNNTTLNFNLNGGSYTTTLTASGANRIGDGAAVVVLNLYGGGSFNAGNFNIGQNAAANGTVNVAGPTTALNVSAASLIGSAGIGALNVSSGATFASTATITLGSVATTSSGSVTVSGAGSTFTVSTNLVVGASGNAAVVVTNGGEMRTVGANNSTTSLRLANSAGTTTALVTGTGSLLQGGNVDVGGSATTKGGNAAVTVSAGGTFGARGAMQLWDTSSLLVDNGNISTGGAFTAYGGSEIGFVLSNPNVDPFFAVGGNLNLSNNVTLTLSLGSSAAFNLNDTVRLFGYKGTLTGAFDGIAQGDILSVGSQSFQIDYGSGTDSFVGLTVVPEPSMLPLFGLAALLLAGARRMMSTPRSGRVSAAKDSIPTSPLR